MKKTALKKKFEKEYPKLKGVCVRYGMPDDYLFDSFIIGHQHDYEYIKRTMIMNWAEDPRKAVIEKSDNIYINAMSLLDPKERLIFNMVCIDSFEFDTISNLLKIDKDLIINYYNKAKIKLEKDEKVSAAINADAAIYV
jgi:hypothetical protein